MSGRTRPLMDRFAEKVNKTETCWLWTGARNAKGYGTIRDGKRQRNAHRVAYELFVGPIPAGLVIDHLCRTRNCVRPDHLDPVTNQVNVKRGTIHGAAVKGWKKAVAA